MGILLGLLTALTWGGADFIARFATHRIGALRSMLYMQLTGFLLLSFLLPALGGWGHLADGSGWQPWAWGFLAGSFNAVSGLALYRAFEIGKMAVVAPLSASYPALTLLLSWMTGERLSIVRIAGIICTLVGVVVVAGGEKTPDENDAEAVRRSGRGIGWACFAAVGFAVLFWLLGTRIIPRVGAVQTVWMIRLTSTLLTAAAILIAKQPVHLPRGTRVALAMDGDRHHFRRNLSHQPVDICFHPSSFFSALSEAFPRTDTLHGGMTPPFCNVALPVPLRTTFTYAVPETLRGTVQPGSRVLVPFRKKAMVGVVVELAESAPQGATIREVTRVLDFVPALTPKLIELAHWIAGYYLAPAGEVFRAMLPPVTELKSQRRIILTDE